MYQMDLSFSSLKMEVCLKVEHIVDVYEEMYHLSRLALTGRRQDVQMFIRRLARRLRRTQPDLAGRLDSLLAESPTRESPLRNESVSALPVDPDSRLRLARVEWPVQLEAQPIWADHIRSKLELVVSERNREGEILKAGLLPTRSLLFTGEPGVGKTLAARWLASRLNRPLLILDLSAVMSSFLGRTGTNVRHVLDYAKSTPCVLLLDELDAIAKRRDDSTEIGELKRLVTVLLQEIDDWPYTGILVAATNHADLLDPAVWRRFDIVIQFSMPNHGQVERMISQFLEPKGVQPEIVSTLACALKELSFSDIGRDLQRVLREEIVSDRPLVEILKRLVHDQARLLPVGEKKEMALYLDSLGLSQREINDWTGLHRKTISETLSRNNGLKSARRS